MTKSKFCKDCKEVEVGKAALCASCKAVRPFTVHGFNRQQLTDNQAVGECPFCGKAKFYVNTLTRQWDCKQGDCGRRGNLPSFLKQIVNHHSDTTSAGSFKSLSENRGIPASYLKAAGLGWDGNQWLIPVESLNGDGCCDVRRWKPGKKGGIQATPGGRLGIFGIGRLTGSDTDCPVYLMEGEWDALAMRWLLSKAGKKGVAVCCPGAHVFKREWASLFGGRDVVVLFDNDGAGTQGMGRAQALLNGVAKSLQFVHWPDSLPDKFDLRDYVLTQTGGKKGFKRCFSQLCELLNSLPPGAVHEGSQAQLDTVGGGKPEGGKVATHLQVWKTFSSWLDLPSSDALVVMFGSVFANRLPSEPVWLFMIAPPGGGKTELLMALSEAWEVITVTSLTSKTLVSGHVGIGGTDPSLIPKLNGKCMVIKDFTSILSMHPGSRDEIFGDLRDAYDGRIEKEFGTGIRKAYISKFGILAGVTPVIDGLSSVHSALGERFIKYRLKVPNQQGEAARIFAALSNLNKETKMRATLCKIATECLNRSLPEDLPSFSLKHTKQLVALAQFTSCLRGSVSRDRYSGEVQHKPTSELGTRIAKQLGSLCIGMAVHLGISKVNKRVMRLARKVAIDSVPDRVEELVKQLHKAGEPVETERLVTLTRFPMTTLRRVLEDAELLRIVRRSGNRRHITWKLTNKVAGLIKTATIYKRKED